MAVPKIMSKKSDTLLKESFNKSVHPLFGNPDEKHNLLKTGSIVLMPLIDEVYMPYVHARMDILSEYQQEALDVACSGSKMLMLVPEKEFARDNDDSIVASRFKGATGVVAEIVGINSSQADSGTDNVTSIIMRTGFIGTVKSASWAGDLVVGLVSEMPIQLIRPTEKQQEISMLLDSVYNDMGRFLQDDSRKALLETLATFPPDSQEKLSYMIMNSPLDTDERHQLLNEPDLTLRRELFLNTLNIHQEKLELRDDLNRRTLQQMSEKQKEEFLRAQIRTLQQELNISVDEAEDEALRQRALSKEWSPETMNAFDKELRKLLRYATNTPDYAVQYSYLDSFLNLPWLHCDSSSFELSDVERILDRDHYALEKVKDRIVEQMAVMKLRKDTKAPILCFVGPPGVGKTSLGKSIAEATGRKYVRVALGGVHDEAEIRGHRRTYLGAMPGRIIQALEKCGTSDPVMVLDEIDKLGADYKGDPQTALLEVLDPEQNSHFHDNYIDHDYDLSKIMFVATANTLDSISSPLLDRMEIIDIGGYVDDEKIQIAKRHLIPRNLERHGFRKDEILFTDDAIQELITFYTRESGVRKLEKRIAEILRKLARSKVSGKEFSHEITKVDVRSLLGAQSNYPDKYESNDLPGVVTGLAWTQSGGEILFIESSVAPGKDSKLTLTGNLGNVMKESAILALQYLKAHAGMLGLSSSAFTDKELHIHVPEGAIPKDGPSAGITMLTSIASAFTGRKVRDKVAMTGELTLRGKVLPVGGIKEKILAAKRAGITDIILSRQNAKDIEEIPSQYLDGLIFHFVDLASEVLDFALLEETAD